MSDVVMKMQMSPTAAGKLFQKSCRQEEEIERLQSELTAARDAAERLRGRVSELEALDAVLPDNWGRRPLEVTDDIVQAATKAVRENLGRSYVAVASHVLNAIWPLLEHPDGRP